MLIEAAHGDIVQLFETRSVRPIKCLLTSVIKNRVGQLPGNNGSKVMKKPE